MDGATHRTTRSRAQSYGWARLRAILARFVVLALFVCCLGLLERGAWAQTEFTATAVAGDGHVNLSWTRIEGGRFGIRVTNQVNDITMMIMDVGGTQHTVTGLTNGITYTFHISGSNSAGVSGSATVSATPRQRLAAPTGLSATAGVGQVDLSWIPVQDATGYYIYRSTTGSNVNDLFTTSGTSYSDTSVTGGTTYSYVVTAVNDSSNSPASNSVSATPQLAAPRLSATPGNTQVDLSWSAVNGVTSYKLYRSTAPGSDSGAALTTVNGTSYTDPDLSNGTTYYYTVKATVGATNSAASNEVSVQPAPVAGAPDPPTGLRATPGDAQVTLSWNAMGGATSYTIKRSSSLGERSTIIAADVTGTSFTNTGLTNGTTYYYVVRAVNAAGTSGDSAPASATPAETPSGAPTLSATPGGAQITLSWSAIGAAASYNLYRSTAPGSFFPGSEFGAPLATVNGTSFIDTGLVNGTTYYYVVRASSEGGGESPASNRVTSIPAPLPSAPTIVATAGDRQVRISWQPVSFATTYSLKRALAAGGPYTMVATGLSHTSCTDIGLVNGTTYYYVVFAVNSSGVGAGSTPASATPRPLPPAEGPGPVRPLADVLENMEGAPWSAVRLAASDQANATLGPNHRNVPAVLPFYANFEGIFIPARNDTRLSIFSDDGCNVYIDGVLVHNMLNRGQHLPALTQSLHPIDVQLVAGQSYNIRVESSNTLFTGTTDADGVSLFAYTHEQNPDRPFVDWREGQPISCAGIRWPQQNTKIRSGAVGTFNAFGASDWDVMERIADGVVTSRDVSDSCTYTWTATGGTFLSANGASTSGKGLATQWRAPVVSVSTSITLTLVVDDQDGANIGVGETGWRDDPERAHRGFNDEPQKFQVTVQVEP